MPLSHPQTAFKDVQLNEEIARDRSGSLNLDYGQNDYGRSGVMPNAPPIHSSDLPSRATSFVSLLDAQERPHTFAQKKKTYDSACAAAGQFEMMNLYSNLYAQCDVAASQILVTQADFADKQRRNNLSYAIDRLLRYVCISVYEETIYT